MAAPALVSMAQQFSGLPMEALIGGPLNAAAKANSAMAVTQMDFMLGTCFNMTGGTGPTDPPSFDPIMLSFSMTKSSVNTTSSVPPTTSIENTTTTFTLPMLTVVPLNSLAVDQVNITFEMEVKSSFSEEASQSTKSSTKASGGFEAKLGYGPFSVSVHGNASYDKEDSANHSTHYQKSNSAKYTVLVHAGQLPLPQGVNTIINAYTANISSPSAS